MIYHILIDRFTGNPAKASTRGFTGGTLLGIIEHLDYLQQLGTTSILLTPFYQTAAYHGYHIMDYDKVDKRFGTMDDLTYLIEEVHRRGMKIIADFVANHCHRANPLFAEHKHRDWFIFNADGSYRCFANFTDLPAFNTRNEEVKKYLTAKCLQLCRMGFDAIRLDHATGPDYTFWTYLTKQVKLYYPSVLFIGEVWGEMDFKPKNKLRYLWHKWRYSAQEARQMEYIGVLDGVLDFEYQSILADAVKKNDTLASNKGLEAKVIKHFRRYRSNFQLWLFLDNHDLDRFLFECRGNENKLNEAIRFTNQWKRPFIWYYGTECGMKNETSIFDGTEYADERVRQCMIWE